VPSRKQHAQSKEGPPPLRPRTKTDKSKVATNSEVPGQSGVLVSRYGSPRLNSGPGNTGIDPFNTLRIGEDGKSQYLISQCKLSVVFPVSTSAMNDLENALSRSLSLTNNW
jgi:hypothetical protein